MDREERELDDTGELPPFAEVLRREERRVLDLHAAEASDDPLEKGPAYADHLPDETGDVVLGALGQLREALVHDHAL